MKKKANIFIDGFNLYYGLKTFGNKYKWLDVQALGESFITQNDTELSQVHYFTALISGDDDASFRQRLYLDALQAHCDKITIHYGHFLHKDKRCHNCGKTSRIPEEKKTDVNIACEILKGAYEDQYDLGYLVSGDSDLVPPVTITTQMEKTIIVAHPPKRKSDELCKAASNWFSISQGKLKKSQMPNQVGTHRRPPTWY